MSRKVYVPNLPTRWDAATRSRVPSFDLNAAAAFGELVVLSEGPLSSDNINDVIDDVQQRSEAIEPDDLVLMVGDVVVTAACLALACDNNKQVRVLRWEKNKRTYDIMEVSL